jgi:hypothetical protein
MPEVSPPEDLPRDIVGLMRQNAFLIAKEIRQEYFEFSKKFFVEIPTKEGLEESTAEPGTLIIDNVNPLIWKDIRGLTIGALDGGVGLEIFGTKIPFMLKAVTYSVIPGKRDSDRERFTPNHFYVSKLSQSFGFSGGDDNTKQIIDVIREIFERRTIIEAMEEIGTLDDFLCHGPLIREMSHYQGAELPKQDSEEIVGKKLHDEFMEVCEKKACGRVGECPFKRSKKDSTHTNLMCLTAFLYKKSLDIAKEKEINLVGVIERSTSSEMIEGFCINVLKNDIALARRILKRDTITKEDIAEEEAMEFCKRTGYDDKLFAGIKLSKGGFTKPLLSKKNKPRAGGRGISSPYRGLENYIPDIKYSYIRTSTTNLPFRVEFPSYVGDSDCRDILSRINLYSSLLPKYAFPINLDIVDKAAKVPKWLSQSFNVYIFRYLQKLIFEKGLDPEEAYIVIANLYEQQRDWATRPKAK